MLGNFYSYAIFMSSILCERNWFQVGPISITEFKYRYTSDQEALVLYRSVLSYQIASHVYERSVMLCVTRASGSHRVFLFCVFDAPWMF
jgi:hypothetical protein